MAIALVLLVLVAGGAGAFMTILAPIAHSGSGERAESQAGADARQALIGRAAVDDNRPGSLPCPDTDNDGIAQLLSGNACPSYVGRLPWRTLGLPDLRDASGERFWYALSPSLRDDESAEPINSATPGQLRISGADPRTDVAAVLIAPGPALDGQRRTPASENDRTQYLERGNADGDNDYEMAPASAAFNDRVTPIMRAHLFNAVEWRVANDIRARLERYYLNGYLPFANDAGSAGFDCTEGRLSGRLPNPDSTSGTAVTCPGHASWDSGLGKPPPAWFFANGWHLITYYALAPACTRATPGCSGAGLLSINGVAGMRAVVIVGSRPLHLQAPACVGPLCIEQPSAGSFAYLRQAQSAAFNDKVAAIR
jgi:hypothetical protein